MNRWKCALLPLAIIALDGCGSGRNISPEKALYNTDWVDRNGNIIRFGGSKLFMRMNYDGSNHETNREYKMKLYGTTQGQTTWQYLIDFEDGSPSGQVLLVVNSSDGNQSINYNVIFYNVWLENRGGYNLLGKFTAETKYSK